MYFLLSIAVKTFSHFFHILIIACFASSQFMACRKIHQALWSAQAQVGGYNSKMHTSHSAGHCYWTHHDLFQWGPTVLFMILMCRWETSSYCWAIGRTLACTRRPSGSSWQKTQGSSLWQLHQLVAWVIYNTRQLWAPDPVLHMSLMLLTKGVDTETVLPVHVSCSKLGTVRTHCSERNRNFPTALKRARQLPWEVENFPINVSNLSHNEGTIFNLQFTML